MSAQQTQRRGTPPSSLRARLRDDARLQSPGWILLPLRAFLGVTFVYAGLSKILDPHYLDSGSPLGVHAQMVHAATASPIGWLVSVSADHATFTGLAIAFGELAAGAGVLLGLLTRLAALGGMLLALSFFLTVSWTTTPYYYGADIVFAFAWTPLLLAGDGSVYSLGAAIRARVREELHLTPQPTARETLAARDAVERRVLLRSGALAGLIGGVTVLGGTAIALVRRTSTGATLTPTPASSPAGTGQPGEDDGSSTPSASSAGSGGVIAAASEVAVGAAKSFTAADGSPAYLLHPSADSFVAFSAVCTHQGCPVSFVGPGFRCPCHGASYDGSGQVTGGPARSPLAKIPVRVVGGNVVRG
ncbi:MAG TPA: Rieske 2Fe-2S domain-containing protein [Kineosporiaceae bacterium]|nr:Rieske 2Fe-2S domain-containing protein [Kineosporiaceae bacterium]